MGFKPKDPKITKEMLASGPAASPPPPAAGVSAAISIPSLTDMVEQLRELNKKMDRDIEYQRQRDTYHEMREIMLLLGGMDLRIQKLIGLLEAKK